MAEGAQAALLIDQNGNYVGVVLDGAIYRLEMAGKLRNVAGSIVNPSTEDTLSTRASESTLATRASEATLAAADTKLGTIDGVLDSIKDTDGIKKITDQLPAGTNEIGKVAQGTKAAGSGAWPQALYDASGNAVGVVLDGGVYRLQSDGKVAKGASSLVHLEVLDTTTGIGRLKSTLYSPDGEAIAFSSVSDNPESIRNQFAMNGSSASLLVDGSTTPVVFTYEADLDHDISLQEIKFVLAANGITFGTGYFGARSGPLPNGLKVEVVAGGQTGTVSILTRNECFIHFASPGGFNWVVSSKDMMSALYVIGGALKLRAGTADQVKVTVQDNLGSAGNYFQCLIKGNVLAA